MWYPAYFTIMIHLLLLLLQFMADAVPGIPHSCLPLTFPLSTLLPLTQVTHIRYHHQFITQNTVPSSHIYPHVNSLYLSTVVSPGASYFVFHIKCIFVFMYLYIYVSVCMQVL